MGIFTKPWSVHAGAPVSGLDHGSPARVYGSLCGCGANTSTASEALQLQRVLGGITHDAQCGRTGGRAGCRGECAGFVGCRRHCCCVEHLLQHKRCKRVAAVRAGAARGSLGMCRSVSQRRLACGM